MLSKGLKAFLFSSKGTFIFSIHAKHELHVLCVSMLKHIWNAFSGIEHGLDVRFSLKSGVKERNKMIKRGKRSEEEKQARKMRTKHTFGLGAELTLVINAGG